LAVLAEDELATTQPHLAVSPDGRLLACFADTDKGAVRIWDAGTGKQVRELAGRSRIEEAPWLSFSADGKLLAGASDDGKARVWNVDNGNLLSESVLQLGPTTRPLDHPGESLDDVLLQRVFFPGLDCIVVNGSLPASHEIARDKFHVLSVQTGKELRTFGDDKLRKIGMALSPDGRRLLSEEYSFSHGKRDRRPPVSGGRRSGTYPGVQRHRGQSGLVPKAVPRDIHVVVAQKLRRPHQR